MASFAIAPDGTGAWLAEQDGTVLSLGSATYHGSPSEVTSATPVISIGVLAVPAPSTIGYDLAQTNGNVASLGGAAYYGSVLGAHMVAPVIDLVPTPDREGYWLIGADASVYPFGDALYEGDAGGTVRTYPVTSAAATPDGLGYWLLTSNGRILGFGDAKSYGQVTTALQSRAVAIVATADGKGYWIATSTGQVFSYGDAEVYLAAGPSPDGQRIVAMAATSDGGGYFLVAANGHVFSFGDAPQLSPPATLRSPIVGLTVTPGDTGAWLAEQDGTVLNLGTAGSHGSLSGVTTPVSAIAGMVLPSPSTFAYDLAEADGKVAALGKAAYYGSAYGKHLVAPIVSLVPTPDHKGYWLIGADGSVYAFGDAKFEGAAGGRLRQDPIVAAAATPDGRGLLARHREGRVLAFGDAPDYGSLRQPFTGRVVGIVGTPDGAGVLDRHAARGRSSTSATPTSTARPGSTRPARTSSPSWRRRTAAATGLPGRTGTWRISATPRALCRPAPIKTKSPVVGMAVTPDGTGGLDGGGERHGLEPRRRHRPRLARQSAGHRPGHLDRRHARRRRLAPAVPERLFRLRHQLAPVQGPEVA